MEGESAYLPAYIGAASHTSAIRQWSSEGANNKSTGCCNNSGGDSEKIHDLSDLDFKASVIANVTSVI